METRTCKVCGETKRFARGTWVTKRGNPEGRTCLACTAAISAAKPKSIAQLEKARERAKSWYALNVKNNPEKLAELNRASKVYQTSKKLTDSNYLETKNAKYRAYYARKKDADSDFTKKLNMYGRRRNSKHKAAILARARLGKLARLNRTPKWLTIEDIKLIEAKYAMAKWLGEVVGVAYHVDHVIPLRGTLVSGLHVPDNLCVLQGSINASKGNKWEV